MKRWVCREGENLSIVTTSGQQPDNAICEARPEWISDELSESNGVVYIDAVKIRKKEENIQKYERKVRINGYKRRLHGLIKPFIYIVLGFVLGRIKFI